MENNNTAITKSDVIKVLTNNGFIVAFNKNFVSEECIGCASVRMTIRDATAEYEYLPDRFVDACIDLSDPNPEDILDEIAKILDICDEALATIASAQMEAHEDVVEKMAIVQEIADQKTALDRLTDAFSECLEMIRESEDFDEKDEIPLLS